MFPALLPDWPAVSTALSDEPVYLLLRGHLDRHLLMHPTIGLGSFLHAHSTLSPILAVPCLELPGCHASLLGFKTLLPCGWRVRPLRVLGHIQYWAALGACLV